MKVDISIKSVLCEGLNLLHQNFPLAADQGPTSLVADLLCVGGRPEAEFAVKME